MPRHPVQADVLTFDQVILKIREEMAHQDQKWGPNKPQSLPGFMLIIRKTLENAEDGWMRNYQSRDAALAELTQAAAVAVCCLMRYGTEGCAGPTNDVPPATLF